MNHLLLLWCLLCDLFFSFLCSCLHYIVCACVSLQSVPKSLDERASGGDGEGGDGAKAWKALFGGASKSSASASLPMLGMKVDRKKNSGRAG